MESLKITKSKLLLICLAVPVIAVIAVTVFKVSIGNLFFFGVLLACPLMHLFMMKGHGDPASPDGGQGGHSHEGKDDTRQTGKSCH